MLIFFAASIDALGIDALEQALSCTQYQRRIVAEGPYRENYERILKEYDDSISRQISDIQETAETKLKALEEKRRIFMSRPENHDECFISELDRYNTEISRLRAKRERYYNLHKLV